MATEKAMETKTELNRDAVRVPDFWRLPWAKGQSAVVAELRCEAHVLRLAGDRDGARYVASLALRMELASAARFEEIRAVALGRFLDE
jgi:hypothetical protein